MSGGGAVEEGRGGVIHDLREDEVLVLRSRGEERIGSLVARKQRRRFGDGVVVSTPHEFDGITDGGIDGEGDVAEDTLSGSDDDSVGSTRST